MPQYNPTTNFGNISSIAAQSHQGKNAFEIGQHLMKEGAERKRHKDIATQKNAREAQAAYNQQHATAIKVNNAINKQKAGQQRQAQATAKKAAATHAAGVKKGTTAPMPGAAPRTFAMPAGPQAQAAQAHAKASEAAAKMMQQQRNSAHGQAIQMQNQMSRQAQQTQSQHARVMKQQINTAHGQALRMQAAKDKTAQAPFKAASKGKAVPLSNPVARPFPEHQASGASERPLPTLSANETAKTGRPNTFSTGSKRAPSAKSNLAGLGALGSKLEEGLATKKFPLPEPRKRV
jgi:hypothetical protein